jgi:hypothetical protein
MAMVYVIEFFNRVELQICKYKIIQKICILGIDRLLKS